jgi:hypothetical protein
MASPMSCGGTLLTSGRLRRSGVGVAHWARGLRALGQKVVRCRRYGRGWLTRSELVGAKIDEDLWFRSWQIHSATALLTLLTFSIKFGSRNSKVKFGSGNPKAESFS